MVFDEKRESSTFENEKAFFFVRFHTKKVALSFLKKIACSKFALAQALSDTTFYLVVLESNGMFEYSIQIPSQ